MNQLWASALVPFGLFVLLCIEKGTIIAIKRYCSKRVAYYWTTDVRTIIREKRQEWRNSRQARANYR